MDQQPSGTAAVVLAGGLGTRLRSVVADRPKVMAEIHGRPFLSYLFDQLLVADIRDVIVCTGYLGTRVTSFFGDSYGSLRIAYSQELSPLGTAGALRLALPLLESEAVLVLNGDSFCGADLATFIEWHSERRARASILLAKMANTDRFGRVHVDHEGRVTGFEEKSPGRGPGLINAGVYLFEREMLRGIPAERPVSLEREIFPRWIAEGLYGCETEARFLDIGTPESFATAEEFFAR
jgi:NDP-sugar pyrophosphorylase family protein